jgi:hypothetical protein
MMDVPLLLFLLSSSNASCSAATVALTPGHNLLGAYGVPGLMPRVAAALGRLMMACHQLYGFSRVTSMMK